MQYKVKMSEPSMTDGIAIIPVSWKYYGMKRIPRPTKALKMDIAVLIVPNFWIYSDCLCLVEMRA